MPRHHRAAYHRRPDRRPQKGKGAKRPRSWHRGPDEYRRWAAHIGPDLHTGADPTGAPTPLSNAKGRTNRGDAA